MKKTLLVGNANTGKTTLLNTLTGAHEHTGNWHGVTVAEKENFFAFDDEEVCVTDLPGIYSLSAMSFEEQLSVDYIFQNSYDLIVCTAELGALKKNLYLLVDLVLAGKTNIVLAVNTMGKKVQNQNFDNIKNAFGIDVLLMDFSKKQDCQKLKKYIKNYCHKNFKKNFFDEIFSLKTKKIINSIKKKFNIKNSEIIKIIEKNNYFLNKINKNKLIFNFFKNFNELTISNLIYEKYNFIDCVLAQNQKTNSLKQSCLDKVLMNKFLAVPCFLCILLGVFYLTFLGLGAWLSDACSFLVQDVCGGFVVGALEGVCQVDWVVALVRDGVFGGAGALVAFLPQVVILFLCLSIMEDTGYFARLAFVFEDLFSGVGLSGKSVYTLLMGFGCSASAIVTTRALDNNATRIKTAIVTPYMSCSAKLPVYAVLCGAFFGASSVWVILLLYFLGVFSALLISALLSKFFLKSASTSFLQEFPPYMLPTLRKIWGHTWQNMKIFLLKIATIFVSVSVIVWCLGSFSFSFQYVGGGAGKSILQTLGEVLAPIFAPLGFGNWGAVSALIAGVVAKEVIVSSIAIFNGIKGGAESQSMKEALTDASSAVHFSAGSALSYLSFCLLYTPCLASVMVLRGEIGWRWTLFSVALQLAFAYLMAFVVFNLYNLANIVGFATMALMILAALVVVFSVFRVVDVFKCKRKCKLCGQCKF